jgi:hypothetical protein
MNDMRVIDTTRQHPVYIPSPALVALPSASYTLSPGIKSFILWVTISLSLYPFLTRHSDYIVIRNSGSLFTPTFCMASLRSGSFVKSFAFVHQRFFLQLKPAWIVDFP